MPQHGGGVVGWRGFEPTREGVNCRQLQQCSPRWRSHGGSERLRVTEVCESRDCGVSAFTPGSPNEWESAWPMRDIGGGARSGRTSVEDRLTRVGYPTDYGLRESEEVRKTGRLETSMRTHGQRPGASAALSLGGTE
ncbi:hypothetical protein NDU88_005671 [Pleurodeles waltl]|uniref:Uncharacterized protein n=1 Tax=Pleurodeles waltl TaxID=8319 RepID=A0AAV7TW37_PLEWA|nr:hypothetical protein NDU88_005671 [Pleurodeles waltl]